MITEKILNGQRVSEFWTTIKQKLSLKQDILSGNENQVVGFNSSGIAIARNAWSNRNLLDDWYFLDPINQGGQLEYTGRTYTIDRWTTYDCAYSKISVNNGFVTLSSTSHSQYKGFFQFIEDYKSLLGKTITFSMLCRTSSEHVFLSIYDGIALHMVDVPADGIWQIISLTAVVSDTANQVRVSSNIYTGFEGDVDCIAAKLELGPIQTLAHKEGDTWILNDPPPNKALELAKCQKYQINLIPSGVSDFVFLGVGTAFSSTVARIFCPLPVSMRAKPTIKIEGAFRLSTNAGWSVGIDVTSITVLGYQAHGVELTVAVAEGLTSGQTYQLCGDSTASKFLLDSNI